MSSTGASAQLDIITTPTSPAKYAHVRLFTMLPSSLLLFRATASLVWARLARGRYSLAGAGAAFRSPRAAAGGDRRVLVLSTAANIVSGEAETARAKTRFTRKK